MTPNKTAYMKERYEQEKREGTDWYTKNKTDPEFLARRTVNSKKHYDATKFTPEYKFDYYRRCSSGRREIAFELTFDQFMAFWQKPCHYCNGSISTIGLDRIDNSKGYLMGNVVECCRPCNVMKQEMSYDEFIAHIRKIYKNLS